MTLASRSHCRNCGKPRPTDEDEFRPADPVLDAAICWDVDEEDCAGMDVWGRVEELRTEFERLKAEAASLAFEVERRKLPAAVVVARLPGGGWKARMKGEPARWEHGCTPSQALGEFLKTHGDAAGLAVEFTEGEQ